MITFTDLLEKAKTNKIAIHTTTEEQAKVLLSELDKRGYEWFGGKKLTIETFYGNYKEKTGYTFEPRHKIAYSSLDFYQNEGYTIIEFEDIEFKE